VKKHLDRDLLPPLCACVASTSRHCAMSAGGTGVSEVRTDSFPSAEMADWGKRRGGREHQGEGIRGADRLVS
jgi:hypothetical protein